MQTAPLLRFTQRVIDEVHSILREKYKVPVNPDMPVRYYLKSTHDERLDELGEALYRMTRGKYRECAVCGGQIPDEVHMVSVTAKVCSACVPAGHPNLYQPGIGEA